jgi:hypothetical protein
MQLAQYTVTRRQSPSLLSYAYRPPGSLWRFSAYCVCLISRMDSGTEIPMTIETMEEKLVRLAGIEPTTLGFGGQYSIH